MNHLFPQGETPDEESINGSAWVDSNRDRATVDLGSGGRLLRPEYLQGPLQAAMRCLPVNSIGPS